MDGLSAGRLRRALDSRAGALFVDLLVIGTVVAGLLGLILGPVRVLWPMEQSYLVITMLSAATAAGAGVVAEIVTRMTGKWRDARIAAALFVYGLVVVPTTTVDPGPEADVVALQTARFVATAGVFALLALSLWSGGPNKRATAWPSVVVISSIVLIVGMSAAGFPAEAIAVLSGMAGRGAVECYGLVGVVMVVFGVVRRQRTTGRIGLGVLVLAAAQVTLHVGSAGVSDPYLPFAVLRLTGLGVVLAAVSLQAGVWHRAERARQEAERAEFRAMREEEQRRRELIDERDHEMRNALFGLSGAARLLGPEGATLPDSDQGELRTALADELARLRGLLERSSNAGSEQGTELIPLLRRLVTLWRAGGTNVELHAPATLRTTASPTALSQVLTNLLSNCERHAPGARVRVRATRAGEAVRIEVSDEGPGLAPGTEQLVLQRQFGDRQGGGSGLGLHVCADLLGKEGGSLTMLATTRKRPGCTAVIEVPVPVTEADSAKPACAEKTRPISRVRLVPASRAARSDQAVTSQDRAFIGGTENP